MAPYDHAPNSPNRGLWAQTATIDWCESNYELSYYVAEFWNTISNFAFIVPQLVQYRALGKYKFIEPSFRSVFLSLASVGIGSFCFHLTLAKSMQMFDETSMIVVTLHGFYLLYIIMQPEVNRRKLATLLICYGLIFLSLYVFLVEWPIFHHTVFGIIVYASATIGFKLKQTYGPHYKYWTVLLLQHLAFVFWLIDKHYCEVLTHFREHFVPSMLKPIFQFHAMWHLLMGLGSHIFICGLIRLHAWTKDREEFRITYQWFGLWITLKKIDSNQDLSASRKEQGRVKFEFAQSQVSCENRPFNESNELKHRLPRQDHNQMVHAEKDFDVNRNHVDFMR